MLLFEEDSPLFSSCCVSEREKERERERERERNENGELDEKSGIRPVLKFAKYDTLNYTTPLKDYVV